MIVYLYDKNSGEFLGEYSPQINPKNPQEFLYPKNSTLIKPVFKQNFASVFDGSKWVFVPDFREQEVINTETKEVFVYKELGELPQGVLLFDEYKLTAEYIALEEERLKEEQKNEILNKLSEIDNKRIRAFCEPEMYSENKSWLEFYNDKAIELRAQLQEL